MTRSFGKPTLFQFVVASFVSVFCALATNTQASTLVVPSSAATNQIDNNGEAIFPSILREQVVYSASEFPAFPILISEIRWRPDTVAGGPVTTTVSNIQINFSTTPSTPDNLNSIFAQNSGADDTTVFSGAMHVVSSFTTLPDGTKAFDITLPLQTPFLYDSSKGNLLIDLRNFSGCVGTLYNNSAPNAVDSVSRIYNVGSANALSSSGGDTGGGVIQLVYVPVAVPPMISSQPTNQTVNYNGTATFTVTAAGQGPLVYQWFFNDTNNPIATGTNASLILSNVQTNQAGIYFVRVTNSFGPTLSSNAVLTVTTLPIITSQPTDVTATAGGSATFAVTANGPALGYQWFFNTNNAILGATNAALTLTNLQPGQVGFYSVVVSNAFGVANSSNASLILGLVVPNYQSTNQTADSGEAIFHSILREQEVYNASEFPAYPIMIREIRWRPDTVAGGPVTTTIPNIQINLSTTANSADHLNSTFAQNTGTNDTVVFSGTLNVVSSFVTLSNGTKAFDINVPLQIPFLFDPSKGNLLLDLRNFSGSAGTLYNNAANASDAVSRIYNTSSANATSSSSGDSAGSVIQLIYAPAPIPPLITSQPTNRTVSIGGTASFSVTVAALPPWTYQWFFNDTNNPIAGATNSLLTVVNAQTNQAGNYFVQVTSSFGSSVSSNALLTVTAAPVITSQPANQTVTAGGTATFTVLADSPASVSYQWFFDSTNLLLNATNGSLTVTNVQQAQLGFYSVQVANSYGPTLSSNAILAFGLVVPNYAVSNQVANNGEAIFPSILREQAVYGASEFPPYPIVINEIRWRPDTFAGGPITTVISNIQINLSTTANSADHLGSFAQNIGTNETVVFSGTMSVASSYLTLSNGTKAFDITLPLQKSFYFDSSKGNLLLDLRNFTGCNATLYNNSVGAVPDTVSRIYNTSDANATVNSGGDSGGGVIQLSYIPAAVPPVITAQPTNRTVTLGGTTTFTVGAVAPASLSYQWFFNDTNSPIDSATNSSLTLVNVQTNQAGNYSVLVTDIYGSTLSSNALFTVTTNAPSITVQPVSRTVLVGTNVTFSVTASGSLPLTYQWFFNTNTVLDGATNSSLVLSNVQAGQAGNYSVLVSNAYGSTNSSNAFLTVNFPVAAIRVISTNVMGGNSVVVPIVLVANGNENTLSFSLNFNTQRMTYASIALGAGAGDASLLPNTAGAPNGVIGLSVQLPPGETFAPGTQEVVRVTFNSLILTGTQITTPVSFASVPINRLLFDAAGNKLATNFVNGNVTITPSDFEADVTPRPAGNRSLDIFDWSQVGRFVAGLDVVTNSAEFQRVDCAPKSTAGDGQLKVTDWVQAGRYGAAVDAPAVVGGPTAAVTPTTLIGGPRTVNLAGGTSVKGVAVTIPVTMQSQGNENGVGFSVNFDPTALKYSSIAKGGAAASATIILNTNQAASGIVGVLVALPTGNNFATGVQEIAKLNFVGLSSVTNNAVTFSSQPVLLAVSDPSANELSANYANSTVTINPPPNLAITLTNGNATLDWPAWATGFNLQSTISLSPSNWTNVLATAQTNGSDVSVTVPVPDDGGYFRLQHP